MRRCEGTYEGGEKIIVDRVDVSPSKPRVPRSSVEIELLVPGVQVSTSQLVGGVVAQGGLRAVRLSTLPALRSSKSRPFLC